MPVVGGSGGGVPASISGVSISGLAIVGGELIATPIGAIGSPSPVVTFQWVSGGVEVPGQIASSYSPVELDSGGTVSVIVTATNLGGSATATASVQVLTDTSGGTGTTPGGSGGGGGITSGTGDDDGNTGTNVNIVDGPAADPTDLDAVAPTYTSFSMTNSGSSLEEDWSYMKSLVENVWTDLQGSAEAIEGTTLADGTFIAVGEVAAGAAIEIEEFPVIMFGVGLLIGEYVFGWILQKVANLFPNPGVFGWHPLGFIKSGLQSVGKALDKSAEDIAGTLIGIVITPVRMLVGLFQRLINVGSQAHAKSATLNNETIPQARHDAVVTANSYTDDSIATVKAQEQTALDKLTTDTNQAISIVKTEAIVGAQQALQTAMDQVIKQIQGDEDTLEKLVTEVQTTLPAEVQQQVNDVIATENQKLTSTATTLTTQMQGIQTEIQNGQATIAAANTDIANATTQIDQLTLQGGNNTQAIATLQQGITAAQETIKNWTTTIDDLESQITGISTTLGNVQQAQQLNTNQLAPFETVGAIGLATVIATIVSTINTIKTEIDTCLVDNCDPTKPNNIHNVLKDILGAITAAAEIGFVAEAVRDPLGTANSLSGTLDAVDDSATSLLNDLLSL